MKAMIIDDERLARVALRRLLAEYPHIEIVGEAEDAGDALTQIMSLQPDVLFLDVQMPSKDGFQLLAELEVAPKVVFTTAYDDYALRAFQVSALDYLVKPIEQEHLARAVEKLGGEKLRGEKIHSQFPQSNTITHSSTVQYLTAEHQVFVKDGDKCWFVRVGDIRLLESEGNYTRLYFGNNKPLLLRTLASMEERLDPSFFIRASRRHVVNMRAITEVESWYGGGLMLTLTDGTKVEMSRRQAQKLREQMTI
ncbi:MAG: response regulator transcription factor [Ignavibacteria bacterium]|nr:response regulator transcription factor [Ignavibacteria bacterium]